MGVPRGRCRSRHHDSRPASFFHQPSSSSSSASSRYSSFGGSSPCYPVFSPGSSVQKDHSGGYFTYPSLLFPPFCSYEKGWPLSDYYRPVCTQQVPTCFNLPHGVSPGDSVRHRGPFVGLHGGSEGRILSRPHGMVLPRVSSIPSGWKDVRFSVSPVWPCSSALGLPQDNSPNQGLHPSSLHQVPFLPGRLPYTSLFQGRFTTGHFHSSSTSGQVRDYSQLQEVFSPSVSDCRVSWSGSPLGLRSPISPRGQSPDYFFSLPAHPLAAFSHSATVGTPPGAPQLRCDFSSSGTPQTSTSHLLDDVSFFSLLQGSACSPGPLLSLSPPGVGESGLPPHVGSYVRPCAGTSAHDRRFSVRLERGSSPAQGLGPMALEFKRDVNQLVGTYGSLPVPSTLLALPSGSECSGDVRQHHSSGLSPTSRDPAVGYSNVSISAGSRVLSSSLHPSSSQAPMWVTECSGGSRLSPRSCSHRVVSGSGDFRVAELPGRSIPGRFVRHSRQRPASDVCLSLSGLPGDRGQCPLPSLGDMGHNLPISSSSSPTPCSSQAMQVSGQGSVGGPLLCSIRLVPGSSGQESGPSSSAGLPLAVPDHQFGQQGVPRQPFRLRSSRVATMRHALLSSGFSSSSLEVLFLAHKVNTTRQYQSVWSYFLTFLSLEGISRLAISKDNAVGIVCNFLSFQLTTYSRGYRTISGYRSALRHPFLFGLGVDIVCPSSDLFLRGAFAFRPPLVAKAMPRWSLNRLLTFLKGPLFEPLEFATSRRLAQKTLCLVLLATGRRIDEVAHLSRLSSQSSSSLVLPWVPGYVPKHHTSSFQSSHPSIGYFSPDGSLVDTLCPVRAYTIFLERSSLWLQALPSSQRHLFLWAHPSSPSPRNARSLSALFISLVKDCRYIHHLPADVPIGPHQMRKLAASYAARVGQPESRVLSVMGFSSRKVFRKNYVAWVPPLLVPCVLPGGPHVPASGT